MLLSLHAGIAAVGVARGHAMKEKKTSELFKFSKAQNYKKYYEQHKLTQNLGVVEGNGHDQTY